MTQHARVVSGTVVEILTALDGHDFADCFPASIIAECVDAPDTVQPGWTYDGKTFAAPSPVMAPAEASVRAAPGPALVHVLDKTTKVTPRDLAYVSGLSSAREDMASIVRIAAVDGRAVSAWFDAALGVSA